jgi:hypothetical protein
LQRSPMPRVMPHLKNFRGFFFACSDPTTRVDKGLHGLLESGRPAIFV